MQETATDCVFKSVALPCPDPKRRGLTDSDPLNDEWAYWVNKISGCSRPKGCDREKWRQRASFTHEHQLCFHITRRKAIWVDNWSIARSRPVIEDNGSLCVSCQTQQHQTDDSGKQ